MLSYYTALLDLLDSLSLYLKKSFADRAVSESEELSSPSEDYLFVLYMNYLINHSDRFAD